MHKQSDLEFNETELCVWHQDYLRSPPLMVRRHVLVFKDLLTYILKVKFTLRSAIREFDISLKMYEFCRKPFRPGFLCEAGPASRPPAAESHCRALDYRKE